MVFVVETQPGKMKHTFTGIRPEFPNLMLHKIINEAIRPFRVELMRRTENGGETQVVETLRTYMLDNLETIRKNVQRYAFTAVPDAEVTLAERKLRRDTYINTVLNKNNTAEITSRDVQFTHSDELLEPLDMSFHSVTFDYTGQFDKDMAQPTPSRVENDLVREVIVGLDRLVVQMTRSHSADNPRTVLAQEAAGFITDIDLMYEAVDSYDPSKVPFHPTAVSLNERENFFNADGAYDVSVVTGEPSGVKESTTRRGVQPDNVPGLS